MSTRQEADPGPVMTAEAQSARVMDEPAAADAVRLPPGPRLPPALQGLAFVVSRRLSMRLMRRRYGSALSLNVPLFGPAVLVSDPALIRQLFLTSPDVAGNIEANLGRVLGSGSLFNLEGAAHHRQRKLLVPPFHGKRMPAYEAIVEEETRREAVSWPEGEPFETLAPMMRITLNAILRAVFGAEGAEFEQLRRLMPAMVALGSKLAVLPVPRTDLGRWSPWGRFNAGRREFDAIVDRLIDKALADPRLEERDDVLAIMLQARYDDGERMTNREVADQLVTLLAAGHETTATTLAWTVERLRRHPDVLARLAAEGDAGGSELRQAVIYEVQRVRPVIDLTARQVKAESLRLGEWVIPRGHSIVAGIGLIHADDAVFPDAASFRPDRFLGIRPDRNQWVPFGGGYRRCLGAAFADMEMNVVLRTLLREFRLAPTTEPSERWRSRGIAYAPAKGGRAVVYRRRRPASAAAGPATAAAAEPAACPYHSTTGT
jgi:cytochrome P450 family 138